MTWFEVEQLYGYIDRLETALENWTLSRSQMQSVKAELIRLNRKLDEEILNPLKPPKKNFMMELFNHIRHCQVCIEERLKY
ncbi:MAG: hypothetical protein JW795_00960 [Chitinivibrionales bacterium]|nr:hypothetical protein [Chitinivibrionales bacterium]